MRKRILLAITFVLLLGISVGRAQTALPYSINFGESQAGWTAVDNSDTPGTTWAYHPTYAQILGEKYGSIMLAPDYGSACDDYYVSPGFSLQSGKTYTAELYTYADNMGMNQAMSFEVGTSNSDMSTFTKFGDLTIDDNSEYPVGQKIKFSVSSDGIYYCAYHSTSPRPNNRTYILEFKLYEGDNSGETPEEVVVEAPYTVDLRTSQEGWTAADNNNDEKTWQASGNMGVMLGMALSGQHDDDYFSPKVTLEAGVTYKITTDVAVIGIPHDYDHVTLTQGTDKTQMTAVKQLSLANSGENWEESFFTPSVGGDYYFSFHNTSSTGGNSISIYSFAIEEYVPEVPAETEIFSTDFSEANPLDGWTIVDANNDGTKWFIEEGYEGPSYDGNTATSANDWIITPALSLEAGSDYLIRYTVAQSGAFDADQMEIKWGATASVDGMTNSLTTETIQTGGSGSIDKVLRLSCTQSGTVYVGFHLTTAVSNGIVTIEKISVSKTSKAKPMTVENLKVSSDYNAKSVTLNWTNPAYDMTNAPILIPLNILIYENGSLVTTLEDRELGAKDTYTYTPANFAGVAQYRVVASIDGVESLPVEAEINLDDVQGEEVAVREFNTVSDYGDWTIENKDGGTTWTQMNYDNGGLRRPRVKNGNDWAISPGVALETGKRYVIKFNLATGRDFPGSMKVWLGGSQTADGMNAELLSVENVRNNGYVLTATPQFSVEENGTYHIGFQVTDVADHLRVTKVGIYYIEPATTGGDDEVLVAEIPYTENFDQSTSTPEGWKIERSSDEYGFKVCSVRENADVLGTKAHSGVNALLSSGHAPEAKVEYIYTPKFSLEPGKRYTVSYWLYMLIQRGEPGHEVSLYKATAQNQEAIEGEPLIFTNSAPQFAWDEQKAEFTVTEAGEYCFAIKVNTPGPNGGDVIIDDFSIQAEEAAIVPVKPAAILSASAMAINSKKQVIFDWNLSRVDVDGNDIPQGSVVKTQIYDGDELIAEPTVTMPDPNTIDAATGLATSYTYTYTDDTKYSGQKIYRLVPSIETEVGPATSCVLSLSSFTDGYLKERAYVADFTEGDNEWTAIDADEDNNTWAHAESAMTTTGKDEWLISPEVTLTVGKSYYVLCEFKTAYNQSVDITFTRGAGQTVEDQTETIYSFNDLIMNKYVVMEVGVNSNAETESNYFGIHVQSENGTQVEIKDFKVMRLMTSNEPEELPYEQDFENRIDINETTLFPNKWGCRTSSSALFRVTTMPENTVAAHSGKYAVVANEYTLGARDELLYTPYFSLEAGKTYEISYYLYMPGNGENITIGGLYEAYTQNESGIELPLLQAMEEPAKEWTKYLVKYTPKYDMDYCFYFMFISTAANSGIIAIDDFKIEKVSGGSGIAEVEDNGGIYYAQSTSTLYVPENIEQVSIFNMQGQLVLDTENSDGTISMANMSKGIYIVKAVNAEGNVISLKVMKN